MKVPRKKAKKILFCWLFRGIPAVLTGEDVGWGDGGSLFLSELTAPGDALLRLGSLATIVVFQIAGCLLALLLPVMPAFRTDMTSQVAIHKERVAIITPRTAKVDFVDPFGSDEATVVEDITEGYVLWGRGGCDIGIGLAIDVALLEPSRRRAEDEICRSLDIAIAEVEARMGIAGVYRILMTKETAVQECQPVTLSMQSHSLPQSGGVILDSEILEGDTGTLDLQRIGAEGAYLLR